MAANIVMVAIVVAIAVLVGFWTVEIVSGTLDRMAQHEHKAAVKTARWKTIMQTTDLRAGTIAKEAKE